LSRSLIKAALLNLIVGNFAVLKKLADFKDRISSLVSCVDAVSNYGKIDFCFIKVVGISPNGARKRAEFAFNFSEWFAQ
jgi:hypothetical protein